MQAVRWCATGGLAGGMAGGVVAYLMTRRQDNQYNQALHSRLPQRIILIRHGQSEANADHTLWRTKPDNQIELTEKGRQQARAAGNRILPLVQQSKVLDMYVSPFVRTLQTARELRLSFEDKIRYTHVDARIREQEMGNYQDSSMKNMRQEQLKVGRFFYRFPTGESGADVHDRVTSWWDSAIIQRAMAPTPPDTVVVVTHGLSMRFILMQVFCWSPETFHTVWNAGNCDVYVLEKNPELGPGSSLRPFMLSKEWDYPESSKSITISVDQGPAEEFVLKNYLSLDQPRTRQFEAAARLVEQQQSLPAGVVRVLDFKFEPGQSKL